MVKLEAYGRRDNLLIHGIPEESNKTCEELVLGVLKEAGKSADHFPFSSLTSLNGSMEKKRHTPN